MAYETDTATGPDNLLDKLRIWLAANGWSVNSWATDNTTYESWTGLIGTGKRLHVQKTAGDSTVMYFNLRSTVRGIPFEDHSSSQTPISGKYHAEVTGLAINGSTGYSGSNTWDKQPGYMQSTGGSWGAAITELSTTAIPAYYFYQDGDTVVVCVEYESGKYQWISFGLLEKQGSYTGGQFVAASLNGHWPSYQLLFDGIDKTSFFCRAYSMRGDGAVYFNADSLAAWRSNGYMGSKSGDDYAEEIEFPGVIPNHSNPSYQYYNTINSFFISRAPNHYNALAPMVPIYVLGKRTNGNYSLLGWPKSIRMLNCLYYDAAEEYTLGSDVWMVFPGHSKSDADARMGFAVKKLT